MRLLITGAGLVGCHLAREAVEAGHTALLMDIGPDPDYVRRVAGDVEAIRGDIRDLPFLLETLRRHRVEAIVHTATLIGPRVQERPYVGLRVNIGGTINVAEAARLTGVQRLIYTSSGSAYRSGPADGPVTEDFPLGASNFYGASKIASEEIIRAYAAHCGYRAAILRLTNVYGYGTYAGGSPGGPVMHRLVAQAARGEPVAINPNVITPKEYTYAKDVAQGALLACLRDTEHDVFNISSGVVSTPLELAQALRKARPGLEVRVEAGEGEPPIASRTVPYDIARAKQELGYQPRYDLERGIADFLATLQAQAG